MSDITIYNLNVKFANPYGATKIPMTILNDNMLEKIVVKDVSIGNERGKNLDVSNKFTGDLSKIKDVHFFKGTYFDRDYFRRLYPSVNIRNNIELADLVIYDEKSLFENDANPTACYNVKDTDLYTTNISNLYKLHAIFMTPGSHDARTYGNYFKFDNLNSEIVNKLVSNGVSGNLQRTYLVKQNAYFEKLANSGLPFITSEEIITKMPSGLRQNNLSINDCLVYLDQVTSGVEAVVKAGLDSLLMFSHDKYLPIQALLYCISQVKPAAKVTFKASNKVTLFKGTFNQLVNIYLEPWTRPDGFFHFLSSVTNLAEKVERQYPNTDFELLKEFVNNPEVFKRFNGCETYSPKLKINYIDFTFSDGPLAAVAEAPIATDPNHNDLPEFAV